MVELKVRRASEAEFSSELFLPQSPHALKLSIVWKFVTNEKGDQKK